MKLSAISLALALAVAACSAVAGPAPRPGASPGPKADDGGDATLTCDFDHAARVNQSQRVDCRLGEQPFHLLHLRGDFEQVSYDHGHLLAQEVEDGVLDEISDVVAQGLDFGCRGDDLLCRAKTVAARALYRCWMGEMERSVSQEFLDGAAALHRGMTDGLGRDPRYSSAEVLEGALSIDFYNLVDGLMRQVQMPHLRLQIGTDLVAQCRDVVEEEAAAFFDGEGFDREDILDALRNLGAGDGHGIELGCTGLAVPASDSGGRHLHARNLDADLVLSWNRAPVLFVIDETDAHPEWHRYVAFGTAGLLYPGGISGVNDAGLAVSLHQMSTTDYATSAPDRQADIAPFVQQRILREAASLDEAIAIAEASRHFAAWTIFVSDARAGEVARIEVNGSRVRVADRAPWALAQTNHFLDPEMREQHFDERDGHYTYNFNKYLESRARLRFVEQRLLERHGAMDVDFAIDTLAGHAEGNRYVEQDGALFESLMSFGRVPVKGYGILSTIVSVDPDTLAADVFMTVGERLPAAHGIYVGFTVDWQNTERPLSFAEPALRRTRQYEDAGLTRFEHSLPRYIEARQTIIAHELGRAVTEEERVERLERAERLLGEARALADQDGILDPSYHYVRARLRHALGLHHAAAEDWAVLDAAARGESRGEQNRPVIDDYQAALIGIYRVVTEDAIAGTTDWPGRAEALAGARARLVALQQNVAPHFDLEKKLRMIDELAAGRTPRLPDVDFITIE